MIDNTPRISADVFYRLKLKAVEKSSTNTGSNSESKTQRTSRLIIQACPHVERINERIRVNGALIDDITLTEALTLALDAREISPILDKTT